MTHPTRDPRLKVRSAVVHRALLPLVALLTAQITIASDLPVKDSQPPMRQSTAATVDDIGDSMPTPIPNGPAEPAFRGWQTDSAADEDMQRWAYRQDKESREAAGDDSVVPMAGNTGPRQGDLDPHIRIHTDEPGIYRIAVDAGNTNNDRAVGVSQRPDGKVYVIGQAGGPGADTKIGIVRLTESGGVRDQSFGTAGRQVITIANNNLVLVKAIGVTKANYERFYILAKDRQNPNNHDFALICLRTYIGSNGPFEACPEFGTTPDGLIRYYDFAGAAGCATNNDEPNDIFFAEDPTNLGDSKFYLAGQAQRHYNGCQDYDIAALRVHMNGELDTSFSDDGKVILGIPPVTGPGDVWWASAFAVAQRADGRVVLGGTAGIGDNRRAIVAQFTNDGVRDFDFCAAGVTSCTSPSSHRGGYRAWSSDTGASVVRALATTFGNGLYVARWLQGSGNVTGRLVRIEGNGGCTIFCNEATMFPTSASVTVPTSMVYHSTPPDDNLDGHIVVANYHYANATPDQSRFVVYRFGANSDQDAIVADTGFSSGPVAQRNDITFPALSGTDRHAVPVNLTQDRQGRYLIVGDARYSSSDMDYGFARLQGDVIFINGVND